MARGRRKRTAGAVAGGPEKRRRDATQAEGESEDEGGNEEDGAEAAQTDEGKPQGVEGQEGEDDEGEADDVEEEDEEEVAEEDAEEEEAEAEQPRRVWRPGVDEIQEGEQLDVEPGTYDMLHRAQAEWPCLSFDVLRDDLGASRTTYPMTAYVVAGTQAKEVADNRIYMMKWSRLYKTSKDGREDSEDDGEDSEASDEDHEALLESKGAPHPGGVNRIRAMPQAAHIVATWSDTGKVLMWNLQSHRKALDRAGEKVVANTKPIYACEAHKTEGFAMDFSPHDTGRFLSGGNDSKIFLWEPVQGGWSAGDDKPFSAHTSSVEDVQWKRHGAGSQAVFASCSSDRSVRVWDTRESSRSKSAIHIAEAHGGDVNVLSWSPCVGELIVTGSDDGGFKIWDTRHIAAGPMANFLWHKKPITSVDWHPTDETVLAVASEDDSVSLWDMAVEDDRVGGEEQVPGESHFPAQLLFLHMGQQDPKEVRWHPQLPSICICTAASGFNIFKTCNI